MLVESDASLLLSCEQKEHSVAVFRSRRAAEGRRRKRANLARQAEVFNDMLRAAASPSDEREATPVATIVGEADGIALSSYVKMGEDAEPWFPAFGQLQHERRHLGGPIVQQYLITEAHLQNMWSESLRVLGEIGWVDIFPVHNLGPDLTAEGMHPFVLHACVHNLHMSTFIFRLQLQRARCSLKTYICACTDVAGEPVCFRPQPLPVTGAASSSVDAAAMLQGVPSANVVAYLVRKLQEMGGGVFSVAFCDRGRHESEHSGTLHACICCAVGTGRWTLALCQTAIIDCIFCYTGTITLSSREYQCECAHGTMQTASTNTAARLSELRAGLSTYS